MAAQNFDDENSQKTAQERLVSAALTHWEQLGGSGISARKLADSAGVAVSAIYHHFGSLEQLLVVAQDAARNEAGQWLAACLKQLRPGPRSAGLFAGFFAGVIDEWCERKRHLAFAWREGQLLGARDSTFSDAARQWELLWSNFWREAAGLFGLDAFAPIMLRIFDNESLLHLFRWRRIADRAALDELAAGLSSWLGLCPPPEAPWRDFAREEALRSMPLPAEPDETTRQILDAAVDLVGEVGAANLTHRGVADRTGLTLGVVSHKFRTKSELVHGAYEAIYARGVAPLRSGEVRVPERDPAAALDGLTAFVHGNRTIGATDELNVAVARDPALRAFAVQLRYLRGQTSLGLLKALLGDGADVSTLDAAMFSGYLSSQIRRPHGVHGAGDPQALRTEFELLISALQGRERFHRVVTEGV